jgi:hypothetical protein
MLRLVFCLTLDLVPSRVAGVPAAPMATTPDESRRRLDDNSVPPFAVHHSWLIVSSAAHASLLPASFILCKSVSASVHTGECSSKIAFSPSGASHTALRPTH